MTSPNVSEIVTTTIRKRSKTLADNISENNALLTRLKSRGNKRTFDGGYAILEELQYAENSTYKRYSGYENLDITPQDVLTAAEYEIKQISVAVTMSGLEELKNSGSQTRQIDLLSARINNAEISMMNGMSEDIYSDGTANGGKQIGGLQLIVADAGTGTVGGINSSTWSFWQNQTYDFSDQGVTAGPATIQAAMNKLWIDCVRNKDRPDLIVADDNYYEFYLRSLQPLQRVMSDKNDLAEAGFENLKYMSADVVLDGGIGGQAPSNHMYFLNTKYLFYRPHVDRDVVALGADRHSINQDALVKLWGWAGNMTCSGRKFQGVMVA